MSGTWIEIFVVAYLIASAVLFRHYVIRVHRARSWLAHGAMLVDVDAANEFAYHHPRFAINVPLQALAQRAGEIGRTDQPVVVYAHRWRDGLLAVRELHRIGFSKVINVAGANTKERLSRAATRAGEADQQRGVSELAHTATKADADPRAGMKDPLPIPRRRGTPR